MIVTCIQGFEVFKFTLGSHRSSYLCLFIFFFCYNSGGVGKTWPPLQWVVNTATKNFPISYLDYIDLKVHSCCKVIFTVYDYTQRSDMVAVLWVDKIVVIFLETVKERLKWNQCTGLVVAKSVRNRILSLAVLSWRSPRKR